MTNMPPADPRIEAVATRLKEAAQKRAEAYAPPTEWQPIWKRPRKPKSIKAKNAELAKQRKRLKAAGVRRFYGAQPRRPRPPAPAEPHRQRRRPPRHPRPVPDAALERLAVVTRLSTVHRVDRPGVDTEWIPSSGLH